jgi:hypothetical protein
MGNVKPFVPDVTKFIAKGQGAPRDPVAAPICHISPPFQGATPVQPRIGTIPPIMPPPVVNGNIDWSGLINAMLAMKAAIEAMLGQRAPFWSIDPSMFRGSGGGSGFGGVTVISGGGGSSKDKEKRGNFVVTKQRTRKEKVYNPDDKSQYIEVERVTHLELTVMATGQKWTWDRGSEGDDE